MKNCGVVAVAIDEIDGAVYLLSERDIADERSGREMTLHMGFEAITVRSGVEKLANSGFGFDLVGRNPRF